MKTRMTLLIATTLLSMSAVAVEPQIVVLDDGSKATVVYQNGNTTTYVKEVKVEADGKTLIVQDQVFNGNRLVRNAAGECFQIKQTLVSMSEFSSGGSKVQSPKVHTEFQSESCNP